MSVRKGRLKVDRPYSQVLVRSSVNKAMSTVMLVMHDVVNKENSFKMALRGC